MNLIGQLIAGLIVGVIARLLLPGREALPEGALGWIITALIGIIGAFVGSWLGTFLGFSQAAASGWIFAIIGAIILLLIVRLIFGRGGTTATTT